MKRRYFYRRPTRREAGLTLIELIVSLVLVGVLSAMTAVFLRVPMQGYFVSRQRTDLTESIELSMRHMEQELGQALPNSVRVRQVGSTYYIEFLATRTSGRYRSDSVGAPAAGGCPGGSQLQSAPATDTCFTTLGTVTNGAQIRTGATGDYVVVRNDQGLPADNAYVTNKSRISGFVASVGSPPESRLTFASIAFKESGNHTFYVVSGPVTYACEGATGLLRRYSGYAIAAGQPAPPVGATSMSIVASNVLGCSLNDTPAPGSLAQRVLSIIVRLQNTQPGNTEPQQANFLVQVPVSKAL